MEDAPPATKAFRSISHKMTLPRNLKSETLDRRMKTTRKVVWGFVAVAVLVIVLVLGLKLRVHRGWGDASSMKTLRPLITEPDRVVIRSGGVRNRKGGKGLFELKHPAQIAELVEKLAGIESVPAMVVTDLNGGRLTFEFYRQGKLIAEVAFFGSDYIHWSGWSGDAAMTKDSSKYIDGLLRAHNVPTRVFDYGDGR